MHNGVLRVPVTAGEEYLVYVHTARPAVVHAALDTIPVAGVRVPKHPVRERREWRRLPCRRSTRCC